MEKDNVTDLRTIRLKRAATEVIEKTVPEHVREAVEAIAVLHGGKSEEWVAAKTAVCVELLNAILQATSESVRLSLPASVSDADVQTIEREVAACGGRMVDRCVFAFSDRLLRLLGP